MQTLTLITALAVTGVAHAQDCPNSCSGHGECVNMNCECFDDWRIPDCSERECPHDLAYGDFPTSDGLFHNYMECSGKGICDRATGECDCFDGFTGKACRRHACPNDCSGHGTCERMQDLTFGAVAGTFFDASTVYLTGLKTAAKTYQVTAERLWDYKKGMACKCDPEWTDVDCGRRMCPRGNDVMSTRLDMDNKQTYQVQNITLFAAGLTGEGKGSSFSDFADGEFALTFVSKMNETFTTRPIVVSYDSDFADAVASALMDLPNNVISNVNVNASLQIEARSGYNTYGLSMMVEFTGKTVSGKQNLLMVRADECLDGCTPKIKGLNLASWTNNLVTYNDDTTTGLSFVKESSAADFNSYECGRRGVCDYLSGVCECFSGYTGQACQDVAELA